MDFVPWRVCRTILADLADNTVLRQRYSAGSIRPGVLVGVLAAIPCRLRTPCRFALTYQKPQKTLAVATRCRVSANCRLQASRPKGMESCKREWQSEVIVVLNVYKRLQCRRGG